MTESVAELQDVPLREQWSDEETEFTPWLVDHISYLEDALGMGLEVQDTEATVGQYFADIHATDLEGERDVIIENQYGRADHRHLGQSLVYAGGFDADIVVWVAEEFDDAHIDAIQWINDRTGIETGLIGVEIGLVRIDDSPVAPTFNVVEKPSRWREYIGEGLSETEREHLRFWTQFDERAEERGLTRHVMDRTTPTASYVTRSFDGAYIRPGATARDRIYCMLRIVDESGNFGGLSRENMQESLLNNLAELDDLSVNKSELETVEWNSRPNKKYDTVVVEYSGPVDRNDPSQWEEYHDWILDASALFEQTFAPHFD